MWLIKLAFKIGEKNLQTLTGNGKEKLNNQLIKNLLT